MKSLLRIYYFISFLYHFLIKLVQSNLYIAWDILTPKMHTQPIIVEVPLSIQSNLGLLLFSNLISMTPGSLSLDISPDKRYIIVHILYFRDEGLLQTDFQKMQNRIKNFAD